MKNLYVTLIATSLIVACGPKSSSTNKPNTNNNAKPTLVGSENPTLLAAVEAFKEEKYDPNTDENKALGEDIAGAEMVLSAKKSDTVEARFDVLIGSSCERISATVAKDKGRSMSVEVTGPNRNGDEAIHAGYALFQTKCLGAKDSCDQIAVMFSKQKDMNGGKQAHVVMAFTRQTDGTYKLEGWPTTKKDAFKSVSEAAKACDAKQQQQQAQTQKPEPKTK